MRLLLVNSCLSDERFTSYEDFQLQVNGNIGNSYISLSLLRMLEFSNVDYRTIRNIWVADPRTIDFNQINSGFDVALLVLQDQIRTDIPDSQFQDASEVLRRLEIPLVAVSLGANSLTGQSPKDVAAGLGVHLRMFLALLFEKAKAVGIRGIYTAETLECLGYSAFRIIGCPSALASGKNRILQARPWESSKGIAATGLFSYRENLTFILQSEEELLRFFFNGSEETAKIQSGYYHYVVNLFDALDHNRVRFFGDFDRWQKYLKKRANIAIGTRFHGAVIALNAGVPAAVTSGDSRSEEMCNLLSIPYFKGALGYQLDIKKIFHEFDYAEINRKHLRIFEENRKFFQDSGLLLKDSPSRLSIHTHQYSLSASDARRLQRSIFLSTYYLANDLTYEKSVAVNALESEKNARKSETEQLQSEIRQVNAEKYSIEKRLLDDEKKISTLQRHIARYDEQNKVIREILTPLWSSAPIRILRGLLRLANKLIRALLRFFTTR